MLILHPPQLYSSPRQQVVLFPLFVGCPTNHLSIHSNSSSSHEGGWWALHTLLSYNPPTAQFSFENTFWHSGFTRSRCRQLTNPSSTHSPLHLYCPASCSRIITFTREPSTPLPHSLIHSPSVFPLLYLTYSLALCNIYMLTTPSF